MKHLLSFLKEIWSDIVSLIRKNAGNFLALLIMISVLLLGGWVAALMFKDDDIGSGRMFLFFNKICPYVLVSWGFVALYWVSMLGYKYFKRKWDISDLCEKECAEDQEDYNRALDNVLDNVLDRRHEEKALRCINIVKNMGVEEGDILEIRASELMRLSEATLTMIESTQPRQENIEKLNLKSRYDIIKGA